MSLARRASSSARAASAFPTRQLFFTLLTALVLFGAGCHQAHAHATLTGSEPFDGEVLDRAPSTVSLKFNEPVSLISATLIGPGGKTLGLDQPESANAIITLHLPSALATGSYALSWRAVSDDGHPIAATVSFAVGKESATPRAAQAVVPDSKVATALWMARLLLFTSLFFGVGGAAFRLLAGELPHQASTFCRFALAIGLVAAPAVVGLQGLDLLGAPLMGLLEASVWSTGFASPYANTAALSACAIVCGLAALHFRDTRVSVPINLAGLILLGLSVCMSGHASVAEPRWLSNAALFMHATSIAWWIGALLPLMLFLRLDRRTAAPPLIRFSRYIPYALVPLVVSGVILAVLQLGPPGASWSSPYGLIFATKLVLVAVLFAIAAWNRWVLTAPAAAGNRHAQGLMRRGIAAEIMLFVLILALVSTWRFTPPPRALALEAPTAAELRIDAQGLEAVVQVVDATVGTNDILVRIKRPDAAAGEATSVRISLQPPDSSLAPVIRQAELSGQGEWRASRIALAVPGIWTIRIDVRVSDFDLVKLTGKIEIGR